MANFIAIIVRLVVGAASLVVSFLVLDAIHDRNTEIIVACLGLLYCFSFIVSRRWQYYGLNVVSLFGMSVSWLSSEPYDQAVRNEIDLPTRRSYVRVSILFAVLVELLCAFRLLTSLLGHGWERLAAPLRPFLDSPDVHVWLDKL